MSSSVNSDEQEMDCSGRSAVPDILAGAKDGGGILGRVQAVDHPDHYHCSVYDRAYLMVLVVIRNALVPAVHPVNPFLLLAVWKSSTHNKQWLMIQKRPLM